MRISAKHIFALSIRDLQKKELGGIHIFFSNNAFLDFVGKALETLKLGDPSNYTLLTSNLRNIIELLGKDTSIRMESAYSAGFLVEGYFDNSTALQRSDIGPKRYACNLVKHAAILRVLNKGNLYSEWMSNKLIHRRILRSAMERELKCCRSLDCEAKYIHNIERWLRWHE